MTAINHSLTGAFIGLSVSNPLLALFLAFGSHFVLDSIPHYEPKGDSKKILASKAFIVMLLADASLCGLLVLLLFTIEANWLIVSACAFAAASPDFMWIKTLVAARTHKPLPIYKNWLVRLHKFVQWSQSPQALWVEAIWFVGMLVLVVSKLHV